MASRKRRRRQRRGIDNPNLYLSYSQRQRVKVTSGDARALKRVQSDIRKMNRDIRNATRYKNPLFPTHTEKRVYTIGGVKVRKTIEVQSSLEKEFRSTRYLYNRESNKMRRENGQGMGKIRITRAQEIFNEKGEQGVREWLNHTRAMAKHRMYYFNGQHLVQAMLKTIHSYDLVGSPEAIDMGEEAYDILIDALNSPIGIDYDQGDYAVAMLYQRFAYNQDTDTPDIVDTKAYELLGFIEALADT